MAFQMVVPVFGEHEDRDDESDDGRGDAEDQQHGRVRHEQTHDEVEDLERSGDPDDAQRQRDQYLGVLAR